MEQATVFAPATVANVAVGFDLFGFPIEGVGDQITVVRKKEPAVSVEILNSSIPIPGSISGGISGGIPAAIPAAIPADPLRNTASVGLIQLIKDLSLTYGFHVIIKKGIPLGSGMGGSAASAVGAIVAANALLEKPLSERALLKYALIGEATASGSAHTDNIAPCLHGGLVFTQEEKVIQIPVPSSLFCVLVHPHSVVETRTARAILKKEIKLADHVIQSRNLAGLITGCFTNDLDLIRQSLKDVLIEPQRASLIPGFYAAKEAALSEGALGFSISGSGPSVFAWVGSRNSAEAVQKGIQKAFKAEGVESDPWISLIHPRGARIISCDL